jgi:glycosyltransferase involved in cell wall biosynthesis
MSSPWSNFKTKKTKKETPKKATTPKTKKKPVKKSITRSKTVPVINNIDSSAFHGNIRVLFVLQPSSIKGGKKFILDGDSNWNMYLRGIIPEIIERRRWHFYVTVPHPQYIDGEFKGTKNDNEEFFYQICHPKIRDNPEFQKYVTFIIMPYERNAFCSRFFFDSYAWKELFKRYTDFDVVWDNYPELLRNLKTVMMSQGLQGPITLTSYYWIDNKDRRKINEDLSYSWRQIDGAMTADIPHVASPVNLTAFLEGMTEYHNEKAIEIVRNKLKMWDFGASESEIELVIDKDNTHRKTKPGQSRMSHPDIDDDKWVILFPNRLRAYTNWKKFIEAINDLSKERDDIVAIMTAPDQNKRQEVLQKACPTLQIVTNKTREDYLRILCRADFACSFFRKEPHGGCASREAMVSGALLLVYPEIAFKEYFPSDYPGFINPNMKDFGKVITRLINEPARLKKGLEMIKEKIPTFCYEYFADDVINEITSKFTYSDTDKKWARYVAETIRSAKGPTAAMYLGLTQLALKDLRKAVEEPEYPIPKWQLNHLIFARSKSQMMQFEDKGKIKYNHWPFGNKDWFSRMRWAMFKELGIKDDTSSSTARYYTTDIED